VGLGPTAYSEFYHQIIIYLNKERIGTFWYVTYFNHPNSIQPVTDVLVHTDSGHCVGVAEGP
jgi:hypothetical protein